VVPDVDGQAVRLLVLLAAGVAGAAVAVARARRRTRGRRAAMAELRAHLIAADGLRDGARVALRGRLVGPPGAAAVGLRLRGREVSGGPPRTEQSARRRPELALELADGASPRRIALDGPLSVVAGAEVIAGRGRDVALIAPLHEEAHALARQVPWTESPSAVGSVGVEFTELHRVPVGSAVVVAGRLVRGPAGSEVGYRDAAERWTLVGSDDAPIQLGSERPGPPSWAAGRWGLGFVLGVLAALGAMRLLPP